MIILQRIRNQLHFPLQQLKLIFPAFQHPVPAQFADLGGQAAKRALQASGKFIPWQVVTVTTDGRLLE